MADPVTAALMVGGGLYSGINAHNQKEDMKQAQRDHANALAIAKQRFMSEQGGLIDKLSAESPANIMSQFNSQMKPDIDRNLNARGLLFSGANAETQARITGQMMALNTDRINAMRQNLISQGTSFDLGAEKDRLTNELARISMPSPFQAGLNGLMQGAQIGKMYNTMGVEPPKTTDLTETLSGKTSTMGMGTGPQSENYLDNLTNNAWWSPDFDSSPYIKGPAARKYK